MPEASSDWSSGTLAKNMRSSLQCLLLLLAGIGVAAENPSSVESQLHVRLSSSKDLYQIGERIVFKVSVVNESDTPTPVLVRSWDWKDLEEMDRRYPKEAAVAVKFHKNPLPNIAEKIRADGLPIPLGTLAIVPSKTFKDSVRFDSHGLSCGTFLKAGFMPAHLNSEFEVTIAPDTRWGPPGKYQFVWQVANSSYLKGSLGPQATSNTVEVEITK